MKKLIVVVFLLVTANAVADSPSGLGRISLGMTKEAIEAIPVSESVALVASMTPYEYKHDTPKAGEDKYNAQVQTPFSPRPIKAVLTFKESKLISLFLDLKDDFVLDKIKAQIEQKYGAPETTDNRKEEQCVYRNGNSFKITSGTLSYKWKGQLPEGQTHASLSDISVDTCPVNLRYATGAIRLKSLHVGYDSAEPSKQVPNVF